MPLLEVNNLSVSFGGIKPVTDFDLTVSDNELVGLIGPNGAGKTTVFNLLTGVYTPTQGSITISGESIVGKKPYQIVERGITRTFQNIRLFKSMTVIDNVKTAFHHHMKYTALEGILRTKKYKEVEKEAETEALRLLKIFDMEHLAYEISNNLPYGQQRKLEIARALAGQPKLLLLDEPAAGMNPNETQELMETIKMIHEKLNTSILLIEHDMSLVMGICKRIVVIDYGKVIAQGTPKEIQSNKKVIGAYLGA
ncbi:MAG TPA: ABC transporter ATP-binding protein [Epulopiscium sp.]|nr:ABC transporter ATP-binding protein [Candidatus Epulonipiscium sp.]